MGKIEIKDGPSFIIKGSVKKQSLSFACTDGEGLSEKSRGIIGRFMHDGAYMINETGEVNEDGNKQGTVTVGGMSVDAVNEKFHHSSHCWSSKSKMSPHLSSTHSKRVDISEPTS